MSTFLKKNVIPGTIKNFEKAGWPMSGWYRDYAFGTVPPIELYEVSKSMASDNLFTSSDKSSTTSVRGSEERFVK
jgi:hypothetical protein